MKTILSSSHIQKNYARIFRSAEQTGKRIGVTRHGRPAAALIPIGDYELILKLVGKNRPIRKSSYR